MSFISSPALPREIWNTTYDGMAHASDWYLVWAYGSEQDIKALEGVPAHFIFFFCGRYKTFVEGVAKGTLPAKTGPREPDGFNLWPSLLDVSWRTIGRGQDWGQPHNDRDQSKPLEYSFTQQQSLRYCHFRAQLHRGQRSFTRLTTRTSAKV